MTVRTGSAGSFTGLSRERVIAAAVDLIDDDGLRALTMRRLGESLGVEAMAVYYYVTGRDDLLNGVVELLTAGVSAETIPDQSTDWRRYLQLQADGFRALFTAHPAAFPLLLTHPAGGGWWLRPPLLNEDWHVRFVGVLRRCGFDDAGCGICYRLFTSFLTGQLIPESVSITANTLADDPAAALRRCLEGQTDFASSFAALLARLALLCRRTPSQRSTGLGALTPPE